MKVANRRSLDKMREREREREKYKEDFWLKKERQLDETGIRGGGHFTSAN